MTENVENPSSVKPGLFVKLVVSSVDPQQAKHFLHRVYASSNGRGPPVTVFGLLHHESKVTQVHFSVRQHHTCDLLVENKQEMFFVTGFRGFKGRPIISQDAHNADKFKMERFCRPDSNYVFSVYAPISYPPQPVLAFTIPQQEGDWVQLWFVGSVKSCDPDRVILKKVVLSGYPTKIHKMTSIVKYMFYNPEDVKWFRPIELWTKYGKRGRIKESVGTHGTMKCMFNEPLQSHDTVCMSLYKRVFPKKWEEGETFSNLQP
eukprot:TRINITY_DN7773_c0_g1_i4.p1 TRINITY_DN7773_c0_g1~~TRINITY_DN7773_c0_g1_i4.p1  ORF type:complete len:273 (-),score=21.88 TRINITY_DN7773_c0_g1_i4:275-1057(-)